MKMLILHPGGLGDIILSIPAISLLRKRYPGAELAVAGNIDYLAPLTAGYAERALSLSELPLHRLYTRAALPDADVCFWRKFDRILSWTGAGDANFVEKLTEVHPCATIASWHPGPNEKRHVSQIFIDSLGTEVLQDCEPQPACIRLAPAAVREGEQWLADHGWNRRDSMIALHPGAGSCEKRWPPDRFIALAKLVSIRMRKTFLIIQGPAEIGLGNRIQQALDPLPSILLESASLDLLAGVLHHCRTFVGNDSGVAHLAAGINIPSVVIFGPTRPQHWAPLGKSIVVLRNSAECGPCLQSRGTEHTCLNSISVEEVYEKLESLVRDTDCELPNPQALRRK